VATRLTGYSSTAPVTDSGKKLEWGSLDGKDAHTSVAVREERGAVELPGCNIRAAHLKGLDVTPNIPCFLVILVTAVCSVRLQRRQRIRPTHGSECCGWVRGDDNSQASGRGLTVIDKKPVESQQKIHGVAMSCTDQVSFCSREESSLVT
jgi:hypothetical protein